MTFESFINQFGVMCLEALGALVATVSALISARINARLKKIEKGIDINGDGHADLDASLGDYCLKCARCGHLNRLDVSTYVKGENKDE